MEQHMTMRNVFIHWFELELELIQTHMTQKPMLRVEVGALGARQVKN